MRPHNNEDQVDVQCNQSEGAIHTYVQKGVRRGRRVVCVCFGMVMEHIYFFFLT